MQFSIGLPKHNARKENITEKQLTNPAIVVAPTKTPIHKATKFVLCLTTTPTTIDNIDCLIIEVHRHLINNLEEIEYPLFMCN